MENKRLIPYSVHLREDIYNKLKEAAKGRKATALVRDAITMIVEGDDEFNGGYNKAIRDVIAAIYEDQWCKTMGINGISMANYLDDLLAPMLVSQNVKNGTKK